MINLSDNGVYLINGNKIINDDNNVSDAILSLGKKPISKDEAKKGTIAYGIMQAHNIGGDKNALKIRFDAMASHDITFVGIIQTARASGLREFPMPYVLTNCHNTLCAVGGTINEDDHVFGLSAAKKYGGIYVPPHIAVIHQYMREMHAECGAMILGSDSHTRYGALGTMAIGEGGGELAKQLLSKTYDVTLPEVVAVYLTGSLRHGVGPQDVALAIIGAVFKNGYVKNKVLEFVGPGIANLSADTRNGIDVMTTETTCLSSVWCTDEVTERFLEMHGRKSAYKKLEPSELAYYDGLVEVNLDTIKPMIALPMHPSNVYEIDELKANPYDILKKAQDDCKEITGGTVPFSLTDKIVNGKLKVDQGVIAGCAGGIYENICIAANILGASAVGSDEYALSVYPASQPVMMRLVENGIATKLMSAGATLRTAFCGPCFGAGDVPAN
ncbi:MAG: hydratase, partial [Oscillospiraceae bacterium]